MVRKLLTALGALLAVFHGGLFVSQLVDGQLADFGTLSEWLLAAVVVVAFLHLRRHRVSLVWGRTATVVWLLAAMLHAPAVAERVAPGSDWATGDIAVVVMQVTAAVSAVTSFLLAALLFGGLRERPVAQRASVARVPFVSLLFDSLLLIAPRPPPSR
jgi:hypothetical protein